MMSLKRPNGWVYQLGEYQERKLWAEGIYAGGRRLTPEYDIDKAVNLSAAYMMDCSDSLVEHVLLEIAYLLNLERNRRNTHVHLS